MTSDFFNKSLFVHIFQWTSSEFFLNFRFSTRKSQSQQNTSKKDHLTYNTVSFNKLHSFYKPQVTWHWKIHAPETKPKTFSLYKFSSKHLVGVRKNISTVPFLVAQEQYSQSTLNANICIFLHIFLRNLFFNFLKAARCLGLTKSFTIFHFNWKFWKFQHFDTSIYSIKMWNFSRQFRLQGYDSV